MTFLSTVETFNLAFIFLIDAGSGVCFLLLFLLVLGLSVFGCARPARSFLLEVSLKGSLVHSNGHVDVFLEFLRSVYLVQLVLYLGFQPIVKRGE